MAFVGVLLMYWFYVLVLNRGYPLGVAAGVKFFVGAFGGQLSSISHIKLKLKISHFTFLKMYTGQKNVNRKSDILIISQMQLCEMSQCFLIGDAVFSDRAQQREKKVRENWNVILTPFILSRSFSFLIYCMRGQSPLRLFSRAAHTVILPG